MSNSSINRKSTWGSHQDFEEAYTHYQKPLSNFIYALTRSKTAAEDITHDVFISAWEHRAALDSNQGIRGYLFTAAKNLIMRYFRQQKVANRYHQYGLQQSELTSGSDERLFALEAEALIREAAHKMPRVRGKVFKLHYHDGLTYDLIAGKLNMNKATIANHLSQAKSDIRKAL